MNWKPLLQVVFKKKLEDLLRFWIMILTFATDSVTKLVSATKTGPKTYWDKGLLEWAKPHLPPEVWKPCKCKAFFVIYVVRTCSQTTIIYNEKVWRRHFKLRKCPHGERKGKTSEAMLIPSTQKGVMMQKTEPIGNSPYGLYWFYRPVTTQPSRCRSCRSCQLRESRRYEHPRLV